MHRRNHCPLLQPCVNRFLCCNPGASITMASDAGGESPAPALPAPSMSPFGVNTNSASHILPASPDTLQSGYEANQPATPVVSSPAGLAFKVRHGTRIAAARALLHFDGNRCLKRLFLYILDCRWTVMLAHCQQRRSLWARSLAMPASAALTGPTAPPSAASNRPTVRATPPLLAFPACRLSTAAQCWPHCPAQIPSCTAQLATA